MGRLRVALIGLGDIAAKAYMPVLAADPDIEPVLVTRDPVRLARLQAAWRIPAGHPTIDDALTAGPAIDAAFVHAATQAHPGIGLRLINAGIPTFIDKPLALEVGPAREIVAAARAAGVTLAVCFNRRFAPSYAQLTGWSGLDTVVLTKNRRSQPDDARIVVFDDFVHVVDTLRFLVTPQPDQVSVVARPDDHGRLSRIAVTFRQGSRLGVGIMDRDSGQTVEVLDVMAPGRARTITDLVDVVDRSEGAAHRRQPDNWASVANQRGFSAMVESFLGAVRRGEVLDGQDALVTHELCDQILSEVDLQLA